MVTTPTLSAICEAAASTAAPPRECPISKAGARCSARSQAAARTRSATLDEKLVEAKSPPLPPSPVKSKRRVAMPRAASARLIFTAAGVSLLQVKQWANSAKARGAKLPSGSSSRALSFAPSAPSNSILRLSMRPS